MLFLDIWERLLLDFDERGRIVYLGLNLLDPCGVREAKVGLQPARAARLFSLARSDAEYPGLETSAHSPRFFQGGLLGDSTWGSGLMGEGVARIGGFNLYRLRNIDMLPFDLKLL